MDHAVNKTLLAVLGEHIEQGPWYEAVMGLDHEGYSASCTFCVNGSLGTGNLHLQVVKFEDQHCGMEVQGALSSQVVNLLRAKANKGVGCMNLPVWKIIVEVTMIRQAHEMVFLTTLYSFNAQEACAMAMVGADIIVAHMGLTTASILGAKTAVSLEDSVRRVQVIMDVASEVNPDVIVLCHGGPISGPKEAEYVLQRTWGVHRFYGASSMERLPIEEAIAGTMQQYKAIQIAG